MSFSRIGGVSEGDNSGGLPEKVVTVELSPFVFEGSKLWRDAQWQNIKIMRDYNGNALPVVLLNPLQARDTAD